MGAEEVIIFDSLVSMIDKGLSSPLALGWFNYWKRWGNYQEPSDKIRGTNSGTDNPMISVGTYFVQSSFTIRGNQFTWLNYQN